MNRKSFGTFKSNQNYDGEIDVIFILNEKNILISKEDIQKILKKYGIKHTVNKLENFIISTTHPSYCVKSYSNTHNGFHKTKEISSNQINHPSDAIPLQKESYDRLEFLGDAVIHAVLAKYIYQRFPDQQEGFMTEVRKKLENSDALAKFSQVLGLDNFVLLSRYLEETKGRQTNMHVLEDAFEAFIGALFIDTDDEENNKDNFELCKLLIIQLIEKVIDMSELLHNETNYKDKLLQYAHKRKWPDPIYGTQCVDAEKKIFVMFVKIRGTIEGVGKGNSKTKGEQQAAAMALKKYRVIHDDSDESDEECEYIIDG